MKSDNTLPIILVLSLVTIVVFTFIEKTSKNKLFGILPLISLLLGALIILVILIKLFTRNKK